MSGSINSASTSLAGQGSTAGAANAGTDQTVSSSQSTQAAASSPSPQGAGSQAASPAGGTGSSTGAAGGVLVTPVTDSQGNLLAPSQVPAPASSGGIMGHLGIIGGVLAAAGAFALYKGLHDSGALDAIMHGGAAAADDGAVELSAAKLAGAKKFVLGGSVGVAGGFGLTVYSSQQKQALMKQQDQYDVQSAAYNQYNSDGELFMQQLPSVLSSYAQDPTDTVASLQQEGIDTSSIPTTVGAGAGAGGADATSATSATGAGGGPIAGLPGSTGTGSTSATSATTPGTGATTASNPTPAATSSLGANWSPQALLSGGYAVTLSSAGSGGSALSGGNFILENVLGDANGYSSFAEADSAAQSAVSDVSSTENFRWVVLQHAGKYYAFQAVTDSSGQAPALSSADGTVAGWRGLKYNMNSTYTSGEWDETAWTQSGGAQTSVWSGDSSAQPSSATSATPSSATSATTTSAAPTTSTTTSSVTAGGPTAGTTDIATAAIGTTFSIGSADGAPGGYLQLQSEVGTGYSDETSAAQAAATARNSGAANKWQRWVVMQGTDGSFHVMQGSIVSAPTQDTGSNLNPVFVYGAGFGEYFNGSSWVAQQGA